MDILDHYLRVVTLLHLFSQKEKLITRKRITPTIDSKDGPRMSKSGTGVVNKCITKTRQ